jgi:hypothetical protein
MNSTPFLLLSKNNSKIGVNQITFGAGDFKPHPPTLAPVFARLDQEMDFTIGSFNFHVGSMRSAHLLNLIKLGPSAGKTKIVVGVTIRVGQGQSSNPPADIPRIATTPGQRGQLRPKSRLCQQPVEIFRTEGPSRRRRRNL